MSYLALFTVFIHVPDLSEQDDLWLFTKAKTFFRNNLSSKLLFNLSSNLKIAQVGLLVWPGLQAWPGLSDGLFKRGF